MGLFIVEFNLRARSPVTVENGDVIVDRGCSTVTVRNVEADSPDDAVNKGRPKADAFLNELCFQYMISLELADVYAVGPQASPETRHIKLHDLKVRVTGGHRKKVPRVLGQVVVKPSDAKAYYRRAAISSDTFDKFRNLYLTIENVASRIAVAEGKDKCSELELTELAPAKMFLLRYAITGELWLFNSF